LYFIYVKGGLRLKSSLEKSKELDMPLEELEKMERALERLQASSLFIEKHIALSEEVKTNILQ